MKSPLFPLLLAISVLLTVWLGILGPLPFDVSNWIDQWQNLVAAAAAIVAAAVAYISAMKQIAQNGEQERNRRSRKHASVRAMLPLALSQIIEYAQDSALTLNGLIPLCVSERFPPMSPTNGLPLPLPHDTLNVLSEFIEYSDEIDVSLVETMVAWIQIHDSRVRSLVLDNADPASTTSILRINIENYVIDAAAVYAAAEALFNYGRRRETQPPTSTSIDWESVRGALKNMRLWDHNHPRLYQILDRRERVTNGPFHRLAQ